MSFQRLSDAMNAIVPQELRHKRGHSDTVLDYGEMRVRARLAERGMSVPNIDNYVENLRAQFAIGNPVCESPIERMALAALLSSDWRSDAEAHIKVVTRQDEERPSCELVIIPQFGFIRCRIDFAVTVLRSDGALRIWAIECDGREFHRDAIDQRKRDYFLNSWGIAVLHLSGAAIYKEVHTEISPLVHAVNVWRMTDERVPLV